jgi:tRNA A-37 threonylcarbamoyl transferase component Bud32
MSEVRDKLKELGQLIESAHEWGNDHHDREYQNILFKEIQELIIDNKTPPSFLRIDSDSRVKVDTYADSDVTNIWNKWLSDNI